jgi:hypothetical protein
MVEPGTVPAGLEEGAGVPIRDLRDRRNPPPPSEPCGFSGLGLPQKPLDLREGFFDGVEDLRE